MSKSRKNFYKNGSIHPRKGKPSLIGKNNHRAKSVIINEIKYDTMKEACEKLNITKYKLSKLIV